MKLASHTGRRAFTLIEVLLAIAIFGGVLTAIYACWSSVLRGSRAALDAAADVQRGRITQRTIEDALGTATLFVENARYYAFYGETDGDYSYLSFVARLPDTFPGAGIYGDLRMRRITFEVRPGSDNKMQLVMTQAPYLYATNLDQEPYSLVLAKHVRLFQVQFYDTNSAGPLGAAGGGQWVDSWLYTNRFPSKIQYAVAFDDGNKASGAAPYVMASVITMPSVGVPDTGGAKQPAGRPGAVDFGNNGLRTGIPPGTRNPGTSTTPRRLGR